MLRKGVAVRGTALIALAFLLTARTALAGTGALITLTDGRVLDAEVLDYAGGNFTVKDEATGVMSRIPAQTVQRIKFKQTQLVELPRQLNRAVAMKAIQERRFSALMRSFEVATAAGGKARVEQIEAELAREATMANATAQQKRDAILGRILALVSLRNLEAARELHGSLARDDALAAFERDMPGVMALLRGKTPDVSAPTTAPRPRREVPRERP